MKKVVITGATGFIGTNLIEYLLQQNIEVTAIVREGSNKKLPINENLKVVECDIGKISSLKLKKDEYDVFYHLAWEGTRGEERNNVEMQLKNIQYTIDAIKFAKTIGCKLFIGTGSQAEYGRIEGKMSPDTATMPDTAYGVAKLCAGQMSRIIANQIGIKHIWTRILSIYGPNDNKNTMIMSSIREMIDNQKSPEYTKGEQMWDYLYVEDMSRALYLIGEKGKNNSVYCAGSGKAQPLYTYIEEIRDQIDKNIKLKLGTKPYAQNQVMNLYGDISKLTEDTGFVPEIDFEEGIKRTIEWYENTRLN